MRRCHDPATQPTLATAASGNYLVEGGNYLVESGNYLVEGVKVVFKSQSVPPCHPPRVARGPEEPEPHICQACYFLCF